MAVFANPTQRLALSVSTLLVLACSGLAAIKAIEPDYLALAQQALAKKDYAGALTALDASLKANPDQPQARLWRGRLRTDRGAFDRALEDLDEAVRLAPTSADALAARGFVQQKRRDFDAAMADFNATLRLDPADPASFSARAAAYMAKGDFDKAVGDFSVAVGMLPRDPRPLVQRGLAQASRMQPEKALEDFEAALVIAPNDVPALLGRAELRRMNKEFAGAIADFTAVLRLEENDLRALMGRAAAFYTSLQPDKAIADFETIIDKYRDFAQPWNDYAWMLATSPTEQVRNGVKAVQMATRACELTEWKSGAFIDTLAAAYAETGDFAAALKCQKLAVESVAGETEEIRNEIAGRVELYRQKSPYREQPK